MDIKTKIPLGFGLMIVLVAAIAFIGWSALSKVTDADEIVREFQNLHEHMLETEVKVDEYRLAASDNLSSQIIKHNKKLITHIDELNSHAAFATKKDELKKIKDAVTGFDKQFKKYSQLTFQVNELSAQNEQAARNFREKAEKNADKSVKKASMLDKLIKKVDNQLEENAAAGNGDKLSALVSSAQRMRAKVETARNAEKYAQSLVNKIFALQYTQQQFLLNGAEEHVTEFTKLTKEIFLTGLKLKKADPKGAGESVKEMLAQISVIRKGFSSIQDAEKAKMEALDKMLATTKSFAQIVSTTVTAAKAEMDESITSSHSLIITGVAIALVLGLFIAFAISKSIVTPINLVIDCMARLREGDYSVKVDDGGRQDEVGRMLRAAEVFRQNGLETEQLRLEQIEHEKQAEEQRRQSLLNMADQLEGRIRSVVQKIDDSVAHVQRTSEQMSANAEKTGNEATTVSQATNEASSNVETVSAATTQLSASIQEISRQVTQVSDSLRNGVLQVDSANKEVVGLSESAQTIGEVVNLIHDIAEQTNLLALNATIEAARAGEAGKGFAVVASEVKNLANQTAKATGQIEEQIATIQNQTKVSVESINDVNVMINNVDQMASGIASAVEEQNAATSDIASNVEMASAGTQNVSERIQYVASAASETSALSSELLETANGLESESRILVKEVDSFLAELRS